MTLTLIYFMNFTNCFLGIGIAMFMVSCIVCIYYSAVAAWAISYFISSFKFALPWATCSNDWNSISKSFNVFFNGLKYFFQNSKHLHDNDISIHLTVLFVVIEMTFWFTILFPTTQDMTIPDLVFRFFFCFQNAQFGIETVLPAVFCKTELCFVTVPVLSIKSIWAVIYRFLKLHHLISMNMYYQVQNTYSKTFFHIYLKIRFIWTVLIAFRICYPGGRDLGWRCYRLLSLHVTAKIWILFGLKTKKHFLAYLNLYPLRFG